MIEEGMQWVNELIFDDGDSTQNLAVSSTLRDAF
jgi:hypothetical protein